jgi:hypothetical protein
LLQFLCDRCKKPIVSASVLRFSVQGSETATTAFGELIPAPRWDPSRSEQYHFENCPSCAKKVLQAMGIKGLALASKK